MKRAYIKKLKNPIICTISILFVGSFSVYAVERYIDVPSFNLSPYDDIENIYKVFGKTELINTPFAHNYLEYYDFGKNIELQFDIYQSNNSIWSISLRKTDLMELSDNDLVSNADAKPLKKKKPPKGITLDDRLTKKGIKFGMTVKELENILKTELDIIDNRTDIMWQSQNGDYGGVSFVFADGKLIKIRWYGVDP